MTDDILGPSAMHIKYSSYVYDGYTHDASIQKLALSL